MTALNTSPNGRRTAAVVTAAASFGFALVQLDVTIVNVALPKIGSTLGLDVSGLQWIVDAYALAFAALLLTGGWLGDRFGARRIYLGGMVVFALASLGCALAPSGAWLIAWRVVQGIGAAAMLPTSLTLINHATGHDSKLRAQMIGWWTAAGSITIAAGPIIGGLLIGLAGWQSIFYVNVPLCAAGLLLTWRLPEATRSEGARGFDLAGQLLAIVALATFTGSVIEARLAGIGSALVIGGFVVALAAALLFILVESRASAPMLPLRLFRSEGFSAAVGYGIIVNFTYYGIVFVLSLYLQRVLGYSAIATGLAYLPLTASFFGVNLFSGWLIGKIGSRLPMIAGAFIDAVGFALLLLLGAGSAYWMMLAPFALMPLGMGLGVPAMTTAVLVSVDRKEAGIASGVLNAARQAGGAIGVALFGALSGDKVAHIVIGLHRSALAAIALLLIGAALAIFAFPRPEQADAKGLEPSAERARGGSKSLQTR